MATKYYSDGTYTKGDGKLYYPGVGVVGTDKSTNVSKAESGSSTPTSSSTQTKKATQSSSNSNRYNTTVTKKNGTTASGYIEDGKSYYSDGTRISAGDSVVDAQGKVWTMGGSSDPDAGLSINDYLTKYGVSNSTNTNKNTYQSEDETNPYDAYAERLQKEYAKQQELIEEKNRLAVEQGVNRLNAQKTNINQSADDNARQAYVMHMQAKKALPQQLASQGITGGATETANLGLQTTYQNNVNTINQNKANALQDIDNAIVELKNTGDLSTVEQVLANNQAALDAYMNNLDKQVGYNQWAQQFNVQQDAAQQDAAQRQQQAYYDYLEQQNKLIASEKEAERDNIMKLYTSGQINRDYAAALLGIPPEYLYDQMGYLTENNQLNLKDKQTGINNTQSLISNRNSGSSGSGSSGSGSSGSKGNQYTQVLSAIQDINTTAGEDYSENLAAARYLLNSDLNGADKIRIMKQTNVRPEAYVRQLVAEGYTVEEVGAFVDSYTSNQEYRDLLMQYAYQG